MSGREDRDDDHLADVEAGAGCTEIWEHLSEQRGSERASEQRERTSENHDDANGASREHRGSERASEQRERTSENHDDASESGSGRASRADE